MRKILPLLLCGLIACGGCSRGPRIAKVKGTVTCGGKPVTSGQIMFHCENGRPALGDIQPDGSYVLTTLKAGDGALVGSHTVTITATKVGAGSMGFASAEEEMRWTEEGMKHGSASTILVPGKVEWLVPEIYSQPKTTTLRALVEKKKNEINFDLE
jgi:hypothetical protein